MASAPTKQVVLFPFPAKGHLAAFLSLAGLLHRLLPSTTITLVSTPANVAALRAGAAAAPFLNLHALPFDAAEHGLPPGSDSPDAIIPALIIRLYEAFETLRPAFDGFIASSLAVAGRGWEEDACSADPVPGGPHVVVVSDVFVAWTVEVARRHGCGHAFFVSCGAFGSAVLHSLLTHFPLRPEETTGRVLLPEYPDVVIHRSQVSVRMLHRPPAAGATDHDGGGSQANRRTTFFDRQLPHGYNTDAVLVNTVAELEPAGLAMLARTLKVPVWPVGPLTRDAATDRPDDDDAAVALRWMDAQPPGSVLYVSFGTNGMLRAEHMLELAAALESSGRRFVWKIKPPADEPGHDHHHHNNDSWLPEGFEERVTASGKGLLVRRWAPQVRILAHPSTAAFLSHCGWNSALESLAHGVPIIGWPLAAEQWYNAMVLENLGACVEVARGSGDGTVVGRRRVAEVVETVMGDTAKGRDMRRRVQELRRVMLDAWNDDGGSSLEASQALLEAMKLK